MKKIISIIALGLALGAVSCTKQEVNENKGMGMLSVDMDFAPQTRALTGDELINTVHQIIKAHHS